MAEGDQGDIAARLQDLDARLAKIEGSQPRGKLKIPYVGDWTDLVKLIGLPMAIMLGCLAFYDQIWTRGEKAQAAEAASIQTKLRDLEDLNAQHYLMQVDGEEDRSFALLEATRGRKERLTGELFASWQGLPDYFTWNERQALAQELLLQGRTDDALLIADSLQDPDLGIIARADLDLFRTRILSADGPALDLDAARARMKSAMETAAELPSDQVRIEMWTKIAFYGLYFELRHGSDCDRTTPLAEIVAEGLGPAALSLGPLDASAAELLETQAKRCS